MLGLELGEHFEMVFLTIFGVIGDISKAEGNESCHQVGIHLPTQVDLHIYWWKYYYRWIESMSDRLLVRSLIELDLSGYIPSWQSRWDFSETTSR